MAQAAPSGRVPRVLAAARAGAAGSGAPWPEKGWAAIATSELMIATAEYEAAETVENARNTGLKELYDALDIETEAQKASLDYLLLLSSKALWRQGFLRCPEYCSDDTPSRDCTCSCPATTLAGRTAYEVMNETGLFDFCLLYTSDAADE